MSRNPCEAPACLGATLICKHRFGFGAWQPLFPIGGFKIMKVRFRALFCLLATLFLNSCVNRPAESAGNSETEFFVRKVKPVLEYYCMECHTDKDAPLYGGFSMETGRSAMTTGRHAPVIRPGKPDESLLYMVLRLGHEDVLGMPPAPDKVLDEEWSAVRRWILAGAAWPPGRDGHLKGPE